MIEQGKKYLVTTDNWFYGPDGQNYKAAWGRCYIGKTAEQLGFTPLRPSTNWYLCVGVDGKEIIIAGCQIHYVIRCEERPVVTVTPATYKQKDTNIEYISNNIYYAE